MFFISLSSVNPLECVSMKNQECKLRPEIVNIGSNDRIFYPFSYIMFKNFDKFSDYENIHSVNLLCLIIHSAAGYFKEKNGEKYLVLDLIDKYEEVFSGIKLEIETINSEKSFYEKLYQKIGVNSDDNVPLNKKLKFLSLIIIIRCVF